MNISFLSDFYAIISKNEKEYPVKYNDECK